MPDFDGSDETTWSSSIRSSLAKLSDDSQERLHRRYGTRTLDDVVELHRARFPKLDRKALPQRVADILGTAEADGPSYEKGPTFDKEPYDKDHGYDKQGFSRTF